MEYTHLGRTGLQVSRLCLGTMNFGPQASEDDSFTIMDQALELDVNFFDTANRYGGHLRVGVTEQIIGRWLNQGGRRDRVVLASKVYVQWVTGETTVAFRPIIPPCLRGQPASPPNRSH